LYSSTLLIFPSATIELLMLLKSSDNASTYK